MMNAEEAQMAAREDREAAAAAAMTSMTSGAWKTRSLAMDMKPANTGLDKDRAAQKLMQNLRELVSSETYDAIEKSVKEQCGDNTDRFVMCVMAQMKKVDPCLGRRCVMRVKDASQGTRIATGSCICADSQASVPGAIRRSGQKRGVDAMSGNNDAISGHVAPEFKSAKCKISDVLGPVASTPSLVRLANENDVKRLEALLCGGVDVNKRDQRGLTALMVAASKGHVQAIRALRSYGAVLEAKDSIAGRTALMWAVASNRFEAARELIEAGADIESIASDGSNPLFISARGGFVSIARLLVQRGAKLDVHDSCGFTPLMFAASFGNTEIVTLLAQKQVAMDNKDRRGCTPLILAARSGRSDTALALAEIGSKAARTTKTVDVVEP
ncbi:Ankyrin repeat domain-containing protein 1 [Hondaea fermentalgiana]|uniref:Ankyrin repeat domain-containing protein 1 n=1 Tax=Hondaea fermentalgiana TaxID=2315210 RepID=A0A2R5GQ56_9STRA|nr:Ankyrin repeat domain-containing protein 1 [Hondaea fermentalgiana]|eukprot:GBG32997.1 Ankyrin repeat domain-containing protein 1 [Hondaea fermentalgiana]